jgi:hypothetical protein
VKNSKEEQMDEFSKKNDEIPKECLKSIKMLTIKPTIDNNVYWNSATTILHNSSGIHPNFSENKFVRTKDKK